jgi:hypothetical protein
MTHWEDDGETQEWGAVVHRHTEYAFRGPRVCGHDAGRYLSLPGLAYRLVPSYHLFLGNRGHGLVVDCNLVDSGRLRYVGPAGHEIYQRYVHLSNL